MRGRFHRFSLWLHRWLGLTLGLYFVVMGLSGSALVYREELDALLNPALYPPVPTENPAPIDAVLGVVDSQERAAIFRVLPPRDGHGAWELWVGQWGPEMRQVFVDPVTADVLGERLMTENVAGWLQWFHYTLLLADPGFLANGIAGLLITLALLTGIVLWWPKTVRQLWLRLTVKASSLKRFMLDVHNATGIWSLPLLVGITLTGVVFPFYTLVDWAVHAVAGPETTPPAPVLDLGDEDSLPPLQPAYATAMRLAAERDLQPSRVNLPRAGQAGLFVRLEPDGRFDAGSRIDLTLDTRTGRVAHLRDTADVTGGTWFMQQMFPVHAGSFAIGTWAGEFVRFVWALCGLVPAVLFVSGIWIWWKKRRPAGRSTRSRSNTPRPSPVAA